MKFRYTYPSPDYLASGRPVGLGDEVNLSQEEADANAVLIQEGKLSPVSEKGEKVARKAAASLPGDNDNGQEG